MAKLRIKNNEFGYLGNPSVKRDGVISDFTLEEVKEYKKCMENPAYFAREYIKIVSLDEGLIPFDLYPYQEKMFDHFNDNRFAIVLACRQSGKSISSVVYIDITNSLSLPREVGKLLSTSDMFISIGILYIYIS